MYILSSPAAEITFWSSFLFETCKKRLSIKTHRVPLLVFHLIHNQNIRLPRWTWKFPYKWYINHSQSLSQGCPTESLTTGVSLPGICFSRMSHGQCLLSKELLAPRVVLPLQNLIGHPVTSVSIMSLTAGTRAVVLIPLACCGFRCRLWARNSKWKIPENNNSYVLNCSPC